MKITCLAKHGALTFCVALGLVGPALHAEPALVQGGAIAITATDVEADVLQRVPEEARGQVLARSASVAQIATNLYTRRAMAGLADAEGMRNDPSVLAALNVARDRVLSDQWLAKIDASVTPEPGVLTGLAQDRYRADPKPYTTPERRQLRHILVAGSEPERRAQAEKLLQELRAGADFESLAKTHSADEHSGVKGGDLGLVERGRMVPEFETAAYALDKPLDISDIVKTKFGYHIIQLVATKPQMVQTFDEVREALEKQILASMRQAARAKEAQRLQTAMVVNPDAVAAFVAQQPPIDLK